MAQRKVKKADRQSDIERAMSMRISRIEGLKFKTARAKALDELE